MIFKSWHFQALKILACLAASVLMVRWFYLIDEYSVNLLFKDQWTFYTPLFEDQSLWQIFTRQHGPHRQGIGLILTKYISDWSHWNGRVESFAIGTLILIGTLLALWLKKKLFGKLHPYDIILITIGLSPVHHELFAYNSNLSHGAMPFLLLILYCISWVSSFKYKYELILLLNFLMIFTGFGIFIGLLTPILFLIQKNIPFTKVKLISYIGVSLLSLVFFFYDYSFAPSQVTLEVVNVNVMDYIVFPLLSLGSFWSFEGYWPSILSGGVSFLGLTYLFLSHLLKAKKRVLPTDLVIIALSGFTLLFVLASAVGRTPEGLDAAKQTRYAIYIAPGIIALYFYLCNLTTQNKNWLKLSFFIILLFPTFHTRNYKERMEVMKAKKEKWALTYIQTESIDAANKEAQLIIYQTKDKNATFKKRLEYLKANELNLYSVPNN